MKSWRFIFSWKWLIATVLVLLGTALCIRLGIWQLDRLAQRRAFNSHYIAISQMPPLELVSANGVDLPSMEYRKVTVTGSFDFAHNFVLRNQYYEGQPGYFLLTPLRISDGTGVLIERGWIPASGNKKPSDWNAYDLPGQVTINGIIRRDEIQINTGSSQNSIIAGTEEKIHYLNIINLGFIGKQLPYTLLPVFIQPNPQPNLQTLPYPYQPEIEISEGPHFGYALQWFAFASILFFGYPFFLRKQKINQEIYKEPFEEK